MAVVSSGFKKGDLILSSKPFAYVLSNVERGKRCDYCFNRSEMLKRCSQCSFAYFCNKECQSKLWDDHKDECKSIHNVHPKEPTPSLRLLAQIIMKIKRYGTEELYEMAGGYKMTFEKLESHSEEVKNDIRCRQQMVAFIGTLKDYIGEKNIPSPAQFTEIFGKMVINTFSIWDSEMQSIGSGLYLGASIFDHSCDPEAEVIFDGTTLLTRAVRDTLNKDFRQIFISYIDQMQCTEDRQRHLRGQYYFTCMCRRCTDPSFDELMCKLHVSDSSSKAVEANSKQKVEEIKQMKKNKAPLSQIWKACLEELEAQNGVLAETHVSRVRLLEFAFDVCVEKNQWINAIEFGLQLLKPYRLFYGDYHPNVCIQLFKIGKIQHLLGLEKEAEKNLLLAEEALAISYGQNHPLYQDLLQLLHLCQKGISTS